MISQSVYTEGQLSRVVVLRYLHKHEQIKRAALGYKCLNESNIKREAALMNIISANVRNGKRLRCLPLVASTWLFPSHTRPPRPYDPRTSSSPSHEAHSRSHIISINSCALHITRKFRNTLAPQFSVQRRLDQCFNRRSSQAWKHPSCFSTMS